MNNKILRIYPIRPTRNKWKINLHRIHICTSNCKIKIINELGNLVLINNPNFKDGKCENYSKVKKTLINISEFNEENGLIDDNSILLNSDYKVIPDRSFKLSIYYPLSYKFEIIISTNTDNGYTLKELIKYIKILYKFIYEEEERTATPQLFKLKKYCISCGNKDFEKYIMQIDTKDIEGECCICFSEYSNEKTIGKLNCEHMFHNNCIKNWFSNTGTCPMCRNNAFECKKCDGSGIIHYEFNGTVIPIEQRGMNLSRNMTNGIFGIYDYDFEDLLIESLSYDRVKKELQMNIIS